MASSMLLQHRALLHEWRTQLTPVGTNPLLKGF